MVWSEPSELESTRTGFSFGPSKRWKRRIVAASKKGISALLDSIAARGQHAVDQRRRVAEVLARIEDGVELLGGKMLARILAQRLAQGLILLHGTLAGALDHLLRLRAADP